jgi:hypothetical protein
MALTNVLQTDADIDAVLDVADQVFAVMAAHA